MNVMHTSHPHLVQERNLELSDLRHLVATNRLHFPFARLDAHSLVREYWSITTECYECALVRSDCLVLRTPDTREHTLLGTAWISPA